MVPQVPEGFRLFLSERGISAYPLPTNMVSTATPLSATVALGHTKWESHRHIHSGNNRYFTDLKNNFLSLSTITIRSDAASKLNLLHSHGFLDRRTVALRVQFTLFSPAPNLFIGVTLLVEQSPTGVLLPSCKVQSVRLHHTPSVWHYGVMVCQVQSITFFYLYNQSSSAEQYASDSTVTLLALLYITWLLFSSPPSQLLFLLLSLLQLCNQVCIMKQLGLMGYWRKPCNWLEVSLTYKHTDMTWKKILHHHVKKKKSPRYLVHMHRCVHSSVNRITVTQLKG